MKPAVSKGKQFEMWSISKNGILWKIGKHLESCLIEAAKVNHMTFNYEYDFCGSKNILINMNMNGMFV